MVFGKILSFGASADKKYQKSQDRHYDEHGRYYWNGILNCAKPSGEVFTSRTLVLVAI